MADRIGVMNFGRLLESGKPQDLYTRPATRFVATFLGAANLLLARQGTDGPRWGAWPATAHGAGMAREREVVAVVRPEEIEVARSRETLSCSGYLGHGVVEEVLFTGALERARIRLEETPDAPILAHATGDGSVFLDATRAQFEQRAFVIGAGQRVTIGVRRAHVLPTPLSSFTICASNSSAAARLAGNPLLLDLSSRMKTRVRTHVDPAFGAPTPGYGTTQPTPGTTVIAAHSDVALDAKWLLEHGVQEILILPEHAASPQRVLIHWTDESVRSATLAMSASVLRHLAAEAIYVDVLPEKTAAAERSLGIRGLLDARSEARAAHGLEIRTEIRFGTAAQVLEQRLDESPAHMLIVGIASASQLTGELAALLAGPRWPVLLVHREREAPANSRSAA